jgi:hypothetical protein
VGDITLKGGSVAAPAVPLVLRRADSHHLTKQHWAVQDLGRFRTQQLIGQVPLTNPPHGGDHAQQYQRKPT